MVAFPLVIKLPARHHILFPLLWSLAAYLGRTHLEASTVGLLAFGVLLVAIHVLPAGEAETFQDPFPWWRPAMRVMQSWQVVFLACSSLAFAFGEPQVHTLEQLGRIFLGEHPRRIPFLFVPLLVAQNGLADRAERTAQWNAWVRRAEVPGLHMLFEADHHSGVIGVEGLRRRRKALDRELYVLNESEQCMNCVRLLGKLCLLNAVVCLLGGTAWRSLTVGQDISSALTDCAAPVLGQALVLMTANLLAATAIGLRLSFPYKYLQRYELLALPQPSEVRKALGGLGAELCLAGMGLPMGLSLAAHTLWGCRARRSTDEASGEVSEARTCPAGEPRPLPEETRPVHREEVGTPYRDAPIWVEVGPGLLSLLDPALGASMVEQVGSIRQILGSEMKLPIPGVHFRDNLCLPSGHYRIGIADTMVAEGAVMQGGLLAIGPERDLPDLDGTIVSEPAYGMPAVWIMPHDRLRAESLGCFVFEPAAVIATHLTESLRRHGHLMLDESRLAVLLESYSTTLALPPNGSEEERVLLEVLRRLLAERVWLGDIATILMTFREWFPVDHELCEESDIQRLVEMIRVTLGAAICRQHSDSTGELNVLMVELPDRPDRPRFLASLQRQLNIMHEMGFPPIVLTSPQDRPALRHLTKACLPDLTVLSEAEVTVKVNFLGKVSAPLRGST